MGDESIAMFCSLTGADETSAEHFLQAAGGDVEVAVGLFMDNGGQSVGGSGPAALEDTVRQPIAPRRGVLMEADDYGVDTSHWIDPRQLAGGSRPAAVVAPFSSTIDLSTERGRRLAELFKVPTEIMFIGTFDGARKLCKSQSRYLLVSLHEGSEFVCQTLNRDLWNKREIQDFILDNLIYMQLVLGTPEGDRYARNYAFNGQHPYIGLIDPRTGKCVRQWSGRVPEPAELIGDVIEWTEAHPLKQGRSNEPIVIDDSDDDVEMVDAPPSAPAVPPALDETAIPATTIEEEPEVGNNVTTLQLRMPDGSRVRRRFRLEQPVAAIFAFCSASLKTPPGSIDVLEHNQSLRDRQTETLGECGLRNASLNVLLL